MGNPNLESEEERANPFHKDNVQQVTLVTLLQIKDLLGAILANMSEDDFAVAQHAHSRGFYVLQPPWVVGEVEDGSQ